MVTQSSTHKKYIAHKHAYFLKLAQTPFHIPFKSARWLLPDSERQGIESRHSTVQKSPSAGLGSYPWKSEVCVLPCVALSPLSYCGELLGDILRSAGHQHALE